MSIAEFNKQVEALWAAYYQCDPRDFGREGTTFLEVERFRGKKLTHTVYIRKRALAEIDPDLRAEVQDVLAVAGPGSVLTSELLLAAWGAQRKLDIQAGLVFHLRPGKLLRPELAAPYVLRRLTGEDKAALYAMKQRCTEEEVDDGYVEADHEIAWGVFRETRLVAVGSGYRRNNFMDFGVLTDPEFRGQGLARHVVCSLSDDTAALGLLPQYRCNRVNTASRRVAEGAGFTLYYTTEGVRLEE